MRKNKKRSLWAVLLPVLTVLMLSGCLGQQDKGAEPLEKGILKVGMNLNIPSMCYLSEETSKPEGFEVEVAQKLAEKLGLELEIIDTSEKNLLKSLDGELYDCVISAVGLADWNESHYGCTEAYADISSVKDKTGLDTEFNKIAVFTKKYNAMTEELNKQLEALKKDGTLKSISEKYFGKDIILQ